MNITKGMINKSKVYILSRGLNYDNIFFYEGGWGFIYNDIVSLFDRKNKELYKNKNKQLIVNDSGFWIKSIRPSVCKFYKGEIFFVK